MSNEVWVPASHSTQYIQPTVPKQRQLSVMLEPTYGAKFQEISQKDKHSAKQWESTEDYRKRP